MTLLVKGEAETETKLDAFRVCCSMGIPFNSPISVAMSSSSFLRSYHRATRTIQACKETFGVYSSKSPSPLIRAAGKSRYISTLSLISLNSQRFINRSKLQRDIKCMAGRNVECIRRGVRSVLFPAQGSSSDLTCHTFPKDTQTPLNSYHHLD
jgi:hypothetical protein